MYDFFKNISSKSTCQSIGVCTLHPSINTLYEILLNEVKQIAFYLVKLKEFGITNNSTMSLCIDCLSIFLINTNYNQKQYLKLLNKIHLEKQEVKKKYIDFCAQKQYPCEILNTEFCFNESFSINQLIEKFEEMTSLKQKNEDNSKLKLFELIKIYCRICAINIVKIKQFEKNYNEFDFEILRFLALCNSYSIRNEKIIRRIISFCDISTKINQKLFKLYENAYGKKQDADISTGEIEGKCILISGSDFKDLENLIHTLEKNQIENINIYTNGALFLAHFYPYFKNNKFIKGHFGTDDSQFDFSIFPGPILITQNFINKIDNLYKGNIYSNKLISFEKFLFIKDNDFSPLIQSAIELEGFLKTKEEEKIIINYDIPKINEFLKNTNEKEIAIIIGKTNDNKCLKEHKGIKILSINCPCENDILDETIEILKEKEIKATFFFSQCNLDNLNVVLSLLNQNFTIYFSHCSNVLINQHAIEALRDYFNIKLIN